MDTHEACLAHCSKYGVHLSNPFNASLSACPACRTFHQVRLFPCTCPESVPEDIDARLHPLDNLSQLRASIANSRLSKQRQRVLLLVKLVPKGRYTTVAVVEECMNIHFQPAGRVHVVGALQKNVWEDVPVHRVVDFGEESCLASGAWLVVRGLLLVMRWRAGICWRARGRRSIRTAGFVVRRFGLFKNDGGSL